MITELEMPPEEVLDTPFLMLGSTAQLAEHADRPAELDIGFVTAFADSADAIAALQ